MSVKTGQAQGSTGTCRGAVWFRSVTGALGRLVGVVAVALRIRQLASGRGMAGDRHRWFESHTQHHTLRLGVRSCQVTRAAACHRRRSQPPAAPLTQDRQLEWNATLIEGEVVQAVPALKEKHTGNLIVSGCGELAHTLAQEGLVDEFWFWVNPHLWPAGPRILDGVGPIRLQLVASTPYRSGVIWLRRPA